MEVFTGSSNGFIESRASKGLPSIFDALYKSSSEYSRPEYLSLIDNPQGTDLFVGISSPLAYSPYKFDALLDSSDVWGNFRSVTLAIETPNVDMLVSSLKFYIKSNPHSSSLVSDILDGKYKVIAPRPHIPVRGLELPYFNSSLSYIGVDHKFLTETPLESLRGSGVGMISSGSRAKKFTYTGESTPLKANQWTTPESVKRTMDSLSYVVLGLSRANRPVWSPWAIAALNYGKPLVSMVNTRDDLYLSPSMAESMSSSELLQVSITQRDTISSESKEYNENSR